MEDREERRGCEGEAGVGRVGSAVEELRVRGRFGVSSDAGAGAGGGGAGGGVGGAVPGELRLRVLVEGDEAGVGGDGGESGAGMGLAAGMRRMGGWMARSRQIS